jgi:hypothetical protein
LDEWHLHTSQDEVRHLDDLVIGGDASDAPEDGSGSPKQNCLGIVGCVR